MKTKRQKRRHEVVWVTVTFLAVAGMVLFLIAPLF